MVDPSGRLPYQGQPISTALRQSYSLASGAGFILPAGQFFAQLGPQAVLQYLDSNDGMWHSFFSGQYETPFNISSDGTNYRIFNVSGTLQGLAITNQGTGYTAAPAITATAPAAGGITALMTGIIGGDLSFAVTAGGNGYTNPVAVITGQQGNGNMVPATATVAFTFNGAITGVTLVSGGCGYTSLPTVTIIDPTGSGAVITPTIVSADAGKLLGVKVTNPGSGYSGTTIPTFTFAPASTTAATALMMMALQSVTTTAGGTGTSTTGVIESDLGFVANNVNTEPMSARPAFATPVFSGGVVQASPAVQDAGFGFQKVPTLGLIQNGVPASVSTLTAVVGGVATWFSLIQMG